MFESFGTLNPEGASQKSISRQRRDDPRCATIRCAAMPYSFTSDCLLLLASFRDLFKEPPADGCTIMNPLAVGLDCKAPAKNLNASLGSCNSIVNSPTQPEPIGRLSNCTGSCTSRFTAWRCGGLDPFGTSQSSVIIFSPVPASIMLTRSGSIPRLLTR